MSWKYPGVKDSCGKLTAVAAVGMMLIGLWDDPEAQILFQAIGPESFQCCQLYKNMLYIRQWKDSSASKKQLIL